MNALSRVLFIIPLAALCACSVTNSSREGFVLTDLEGRPGCRVLTYDGEVIIRQNKSNGNRSVWGVGKACPKLLPGSSDTKIWRQARIKVPNRHVAQMQTKRNVAGVVQTITVRRNHNYKRHERFAYVWFKHLPNSDRR